MGGASSIRLRSKRPRVSQGGTRHRSSQARTVARTSESASGKVGPRRVPVRWKAPMADPTCLVGIDVAKATLDLAVRPTGETWQVPNEDPASRQLADTVFVVDSDGVRLLPVRSALADVERSVLSRAFKDPTPRPDC